MRFETAEKRTSPFGFWSGDTTAGGTDGESAAVSRFAFSVGTALLPDVSGFSGPVPLSAATFGLTPEKGNEEQGKPSQLQQRRENKPHVQPSASANAINHANTNSCESRAPSAPSSTSASVVHGTVVVGAAAEVPCHAPGLPWSTIAVHAPVPAPREGLCDCERAIRARIGS